MAELDGSTVAVSDDDCSSIVVVVEEDEAVLSGAVVALSQAESIAVYAIAANKG
jgi:outer membrane lipoprotein SlyB